MRGLIPVSYIQEYKQVVLLGLNIVCVYPIGGVAKRVALAIFPVLPVKEDIPTRYAGRYRHLCGIPKGTQTERSPSGVDCGFCWYLRGRMQHECRVLWLLVALCAKLH